MHSNFKCSYCGSFSSTWMEEINQHGGYKTTTGFNYPLGYKESKVPIPHREDNPYVEVF